MTFELELSLRPDHVTGSHVGLCGFVRERNFGSIFMDNLCIRLGVKVIFRAKIIKQASNMVHAKFHSVTLCIF